MSNILQMMQIKWSLDCRVNQLPAFKGCMDEFPYLC